MHGNGMAMPNQNRNGYGMPMANHGHVAAYPHPHPQAHRPPQQQQQQHQAHYRDQTEPPTLPQSSVEKKHGFSVVKVNDAIHHENDEDEDDDDSFDIYKQHPPHDSDDSSHDDGHRAPVDDGVDGDEETVNISSYNISPNNAMMMNNQMSLPEVPKLPELVAIEDIDVAPQEQELNKHVGFVIKLNLKLVQLNAECRALYPKLSSDLVDSKVSQFASKEFESLTAENVRFKLENDELREQTQNFVSAQQQVNALTAEVQRLRTLTRQLSEQQQQSGAQQQDYREMISQESRAYVTELQRQLDIYRDKVTYLSQQSNHCMHAIQNSIQYQRAAQEHTHAAFAELEPLKKHLQFLEEQLLAAEAHQQQQQQQQQAQPPPDNNHDNAAAVAEVRREHALELEKMNASKKQLQEQIAVLEQAQSLKMQESLQEQVHHEHKYKNEVHELQERLSNVEAQRIVFEQEMEHKVQTEQERADRYRAKYESVKQHVRTMEIQKDEYVKVNEELRAQNDQFRDLIKELKTQIAMWQRQQQEQQQQQQQQMYGQAPLPPQQQPQPQQAQYGVGPYGGGLGGGMDAAASMNSQAQQSHQLQQLMMQQDSLSRSQQQRYGPQMLGGHDMQASHDYAAASSVQSSYNQPYGFGAMEDNASQFSGMNGMMQPQQPLPMQGGAPPDPATLWRKHTKTITEKGTKKRVLVEWHFVTTDGERHTVVLQHTQDNKPKTRRMLFVDGSEKYNNKSSASSFRIEIEQDIIVVSIDQMESYQYRLSINNSDFDDAHKTWLAKNMH